MKARLFLPVILFLICRLSGAQTVAQNWTHTDCINSNSFTLFNMLDSNKVVVMEFEMGCSSCNLAAQNLETIKQAYDASYPGQVKFFAMDYWASHTCSNVQTFVSTNALSFTGFAGCAADKNYYSSSSPMPMIVITGGPNHTVYYKALSYDTTHNSAIVSAINQALSDIAAGVFNPSSTPLTVSLASDPAFNDIFLNINSAGNVNMEVEVFNLLGDKIAVQRVDLRDKGFSQVKLNLPPLQGGLYFVRYCHNNLSRTLKFITGK